MQPVARQLQQLCYKIGNGYVFYVVHAKELPGRQLGQPSELLVECQPVKRRLGGCCEMTASLGVQAYLRDIAGSGPDHRNKARYTNFFSFPVRIKVMCTLYCSLLSVQQHCLKKKTMCIS
jgi:hypothetical protein